MYKFGNHVIKCVECGKEFHQQGKNHKFCNTECSRSYNRARMPPPPTPKPKLLGVTINCVGCGKEIIRDSSNRRRCESCRIESRNAFRILERDEFICCYCGKSSLEDGVKLTIDHIIPQANGGSNEAQNLITACSSCNSAKCDKQLSERIINRLLMIVNVRNNEVGIMPSTLIRS